MEEHRAADRLYRLGRDYLAIRNYDKAGRYLSDAVIRGSRRAARLLFSLGVQSFRQRTRDGYARAEDCFQVLADRGSAENCLYLGFMCRDGCGRRHDVRAAFDYFNEAYQLGDVRGAFQAGMLILRDARRYEEAQAAAMEWLSIAADGGIAEANRHIGLLLCDNVAEHHAKALQWFFRGIRGGDVRSRVYAADLYLSGLGVPKNERAALELLRQAAEAGDCKANAILGDFYATGTHVARDRELARIYYERAERKEPEKKEL